MSQLTIALLQMTSNGSDQDANLAKGEAFCRQAHEMGADIALFPEMWNIGYSGFCAPAKWPLPMPRSTPATLTNWNPPARREKTSTSAPWTQLRDRSNSAR